VTAILLEHTEEVGIRLKGQNSSMRIHVFPPADTHTHVGSTIDDEGLITIQVELVSLLPEIHAVEVCERLAVNY
jgi:hypothetical protein